MQWSTEQYGQRRRRRGATEACVHCSARFGVCSSLGRLDPWIAVEIDLWPSFLFGKLNLNKRYKVHFEILHFHANDHFGSCSVMSQINCKKTSNERKLQPAHSWQPFKFSNTPIATPHRLPRAFFPSPYLEPNETQTLPLHHSVRFSVGTDQANSAFPLHPRPVEGGTQPLFQLLDDVQRTTPTFLS